MYNKAKVVNSVTEKVVRSLRDLEDALAQAAREGGCRIRVGEQIAALISIQDVGDEEAERFLAHPAVVDRLNQAVQSLSHGQGISHEEVLKRFGARNA